MSNILVALGGGISSYKICELVRLLIKASHQVRVIMTDSATKFVSPLTFEALSSHQVYTHLFSDGSYGHAHIELARWCDVMVIAPTTADLLAKFAHGMADDLLTTTYLACNKPILLVPAMNTVMWKNEVVAQNVQTLLTRKNHMMLSPDDGLLSCGEFGSGKMVSPETIFHTAEKLAQPATVLTGKKILITAGPTHEYIDPVRYLSNPSSGKMGMALALCAWKMGASVSLVHGPMSVSHLPGITYISVSSAKEMFEACQAQDFDLFISSAAVSDYAPQEQYEKMKKGSEQLDIKLFSTVDILKTLSANRKAHQKFVGFAAETNDLIENAKKKLNDKHLDLVIANRVQKNSIGFSMDEMEIGILHPHGSEKWISKQSKDTLAKIILKEIELIL